MTSKGMIGYKHLLEKNIFPHHAAYLQLQFSLLVTHITTCHYHTYINLYKFYQEFCVQSIFCN